MKQEFKDDDILRFLYDEMDHSESEAFLEALCIDESLWERFENFQSVKKEVAELSFEPSDVSIGNIMDFVKESNPTEQKAPKGKSSSSFTGVNLLLTLTLIMAASFAIIGSFWQSNDNYLSVSEQLIQNNSTIEDKLDWEDEMLDQKIDKIKLNLQNLQDEPENPIF